MRKPTPMNLGSWTAIGIGVGTAIFAGTDQPAWIAFGAAGGVAIGAVLSSLSSKSDGDK